MIILFKKRTSPGFISLLFLVFFIFMQSSAFCSFPDKCQGEGMIVKTDGFVIKKVQANLVSLYLVQPEATVELTDTTGKSREIDVKISNISPVRYSYSAKDGKITQKGKRYVTWTLPVPANRKVDLKVAPTLEKSDKFIFAVLGDSRYGTKIHQEILRRIAKTDAIFAINVGDIINHGQKAEYEAYVKEIADFPLPYFVAAGNHETNYRNGRKYFEEYVNPLTYSFRQGQFNFIILDNNDGISDSMYSWVTGNLRTGTENFIFMHTPPFSPWEIHRDHCMSPNDGARFMKLMQKFHVPYVFAGHIHGYNCTEKNGTKYVISGCAGANPYVLPVQGGFYNYVLVHVNGKKATMEMFKVLP